MRRFDLCVIGGGPSGYAAVMRALDFGKKVLLIEKNKIGGAGIYNGALASKTMWEFSNRIKTVREELGDDKTADLSFDRVKQIIGEAIFERKNILLTQLNLIKKKSDLLTYVRGTASFISANEIKIVNKKGKEELIYSKDIIIATGSRPRKMAIIEADEKTILTSDGIMHLNEFPKSLVILGAGIIGCEFASMFANFGKTKVYIIDKEERILPFEDLDVSNLVSENLRNNGVTVHEKAKLIRMEKINNEVEYEIELENGLHEIIKVEKALLSIGRTPNIEELNLTNAGINFTEKGIFVPPDDTQTNIYNIHAVGDVSGHIALINIGEREARHSIVKLFGNYSVKPIRYKIISTIMFLNPEVALVGMNEQQLIKKKYPLPCCKSRLLYFKQSNSHEKNKWFF